MNEPARSPATARAGSRPGDWILLWVFLAAAGGALWMLTERWDASILDRYEFRQLQTALSAFWMQRAGFQFDYLTPLFGPPWSIPMEFPTYQAIVATVASLGGLPLEQAGRLVGVLFFAATLPALYDLLGVAGLTPSRRLLALTLVVTSPIYLFYPRTFMIETTALCLAVWFLCALRRTLETRGLGWLIAAVLLALLAALTKITTFAVYAVPGAALTLVALGRAHRSGAGAAWQRLGAPAWRALLPVAVALVATAAWVAHGDAIKHSNPYTGFLASTELSRWNYGPLALRAEPSFWQHIGENITRHLLSEGALAIALVCAALATPRARWTALVGLIGFLAGPLIFANLYHVHDYYYAANALLLVAAAGVALASAWDHPHFPAAARWTALGAILALQYYAFDRGYHYYYWKAAPPPPDLAAIAREATPPDGVLLVSGDDWNPLLPYYAQRRAVMVAGGRDDEPRVLEDVLGRLPTDSIKAMLLVGDDVRRNRELVRARAARFGLAPQPFASSDTADLYLPADAIAPALERLRGRHFASARVLLASAPAPSIPDAKEQEFRADEFPMAAPAPSRARSQFGVTVGDLDGRRVIFAHAASEIYFQPPPGATRIAAIVGLAPSASAKPPPEASDGVTVEIVELQADGLRRSLWRRELAPATRPSDRGPQEIDFASAVPFSGQLVFRVDPGPAGNFAYDQAYWARIEIR
ncbi:MAG: glycosyltransferase family 39 protein [Opitutae bacterium]|nr:glycosyltransferase family 39 protein [Opitutae bacterium]